MKLFAIAAAAYCFCLLAIFPGYFHPLSPHHDDFYFPPGLSLDGHSIWEKLQWPRPLGFLAVQFVGIAGLNVYLFVLVLITLANAVLTMALAQRIFGRPVSWFMAAAYCLLLFSHPDFYMNYLHDGFGTLSYFYLILAMHSWYRYRDSGRQVYVGVCAVLLFLIAFTKETYFVSAICFWLGQIYLCRDRQRRAGLLLGAASIVFFTAGLAANAHSMTAVLHVNTGAASPYHVSLTPAPVMRALVFYVSRLFHPAVMAIVLGGIAVLYRSREQLILAVTLLAAGVSALAPYAVLPNHLERMYSWTGAFLAFSPVLFLSRPLGRQAIWPTVGVYAGVAALVLVSILTGRARYDDHRWGIAQEKINRNILESFPELKTFDPAAVRLLIAGLNMPFQPFHTASYIRAEFGSNRKWTVVIPRGARARSEPPVEFCPPQSIQPGAYDAAFGFGSDGRLLYRWTRDQLKQASARREIDAILFPELRAIFDSLAKDPAAWEPTLRAGVVYYDWGELHEAADYLERSAELNHHQNSYPLFFLGKVRESEGMFADARRYYAQAVALDSGGTNPAFREALDRLARR